MKRKLSLFEAFGVELEYMIVDRDTLRVTPAADELIHSVTGEYTADVDCGPIAWSNELVNHVIELKTNGPAADLHVLPALFSENIADINSRLEDLHAMLLPTAAHPFMDPLTETKIWAHESNEIYELYNSIFDCRGHGWSNLQSTHLNLPFASDEEFGRLHAAIRIILPILPALSASSPILDGMATGFKDTRLEYYRHNQKKIPSICGRVIPEPIFTEQAYRKDILEVIKKDVEPYDRQGILKSNFLNSRGAIARFDRGAIEIRIIDIQECPMADIAILELVIEAIRKFSDPGLAMYPIGVEKLHSILVDVIRDGEDTLIREPEYLGVFGFSQPVTARQCWQSMSGSMQLKHHPAINHILHEGTLSTRILRKLPANFSHTQLVGVYRELALCLQNGNLFT